MACINHTTVSNRVPGTNFVIVLVHSFMYVHKSIMNVVPKQSSVFSGASIAM